MPSAAKSVRLRSPLSSNVRHQSHMASMAPSYNWTCGACGNTNPKGTSVCTVCECPAASTTKQQDAHRIAREKFAGTYVEPPERADPTPAQVGNALDFIYKMITRRFYLGAILGAGSFLAFKIFAPQYLKTNFITPSLGVILVVALSAWPPGSLLLRLRCPSCGGAWRPGVPKLRRLQLITQWALYDWRRCGTCDISMSRLDRLR